MLQGRPHRGETEFQKLGGEGRPHAWAEAMIEYAGGHERRSQQALKDFIAKHANDMAYQVGDVYAWRGEQDKAFVWLERVLPTNATAV